MSELTVMHCYLELEERDINPLSFNVATSEIPWVRDFISINIAEEINEDDDLETEEGTEASNDGQG
jgi:hypothetical protein